MSIDGMQLKIIYLRSLLIGISLIFLQSACNKSDEIPAITSFNYKNQTSEIVRITVYNNSNDVTYDSTLQPASEVLVTFKDLSANGPGIGGPFPGYKRILLTFAESNLCLENFPKITSNIMYDNFSPAMYYQNNNVLIYNIDQEELDAATPCQ